MHVHVGKELGAQAKPTHRIPALKQSGDKMHQPIRCPQVP